MAATISQSDLQRWPRELATIQNAAPLLPAEDPPTDLKTALQSWRSAGVRADRHGSPDLLAQLQRALIVPVDTVLCSILDDEPDLRLNAAVAVRSPELIVAAVQRLTKLTGAKHGSIAIESPAPSEWDRPLRAAAKSAAVTIVELPNDYPQADPTLLLYTLANRRLKPGDLPVEQGVLLLDAPAAVAVACGKMPTVPLGVLDHDKPHAIYMDVQVGATLADSLAGVDTDGKVLLGGDWRRDRRLSPDLIVDGSELAIHVMWLGARRNSEPCIRCGWCAEVCPTRVSPALILEAAQRGDAAMASMGGVNACIECGLCDQVCPSNLPLLSAIRIVRPAAKA
jgi:electron transport complex protein RnfC